MTMPRFSPDGKTIYFIGQRILGANDSTQGIYSVPTEVGSNQDPDRKQRRHS